MSTTTVADWTETHPLYVARYSTDETAEGDRAYAHHSLIDTMERRELGVERVEAIYAARHADVAPEIVAYVYDESDEDGACYGWRLHRSDGRIGAEEWWYEDAESAVTDARRAVEVEV